MNVSIVDTTASPDELRAAFVESRLRFTKGYGLQTAMGIPIVRWSLERQALAKRKANEQQHGQPAPVQQGK